MVMISRYAVLIVAMLSGCTTTEPKRRVLELYTEAVTLSSYAFRCDANAAAEFGAQLDALQPALETSVGRDAIFQVRRQVNDEFSTTSFTSCPTAADVSQAQSRVRALLKVLQVHRP
jgi:hypothetical protein